MPLKAHNQKNKNEKKESNSIKDKVLLRHRQ
jgi:hypothetical protein